MRLIQWPTPVAQRQLRSHSWGDKPEVEYWTQRDDGMKVTPEGLGSEEGLKVRHVWQEGLQCNQEQQVLSEEQVEGMVEATMDAALTRRCQEKAPKGRLFLTGEEKAAMAVQATRSLSDEEAVSVLLQSTVVAEAESSRYYKAEQKKQAQERAEAQWEMENPCPAWGPEELYFDCHTATVEMQAASALGASQQE